MTTTSGFKRTSRKLAACVALLAAGAAAEAATVAPYFMGWGWYSNTYRANSLMTAKRDGGVDAVTIAFGISGGGCTLSGGLDTIQWNPGARDDVRQFIAEGGKVIMSFGGAAGQYLESACSENDMYNLVKGLIDTHRIYSLDFDIEGAQLGNTTLNTKRNNVIRRLQQTYPDLYVSFTLPVELWGLPDQAMTLLRSANNAGVRVSLVNIMTMDYGLGNVQGKRMGDVAIGSANGTFNQLKTIFTGRNDSQIWSMIGITPMIGENDDHSFFRQSDATQVANFVKEKGIGLLSFWAIQRDQLGSNDLNIYSNLNSRNYEFYQLMATAKGGGSSEPPPTNPGAFPQGTYTIVSAYSGKCIDVDAASFADGANIQQYQCNGTGAQQFSVVDTGNGWYKLINVNSGKAMDVAEASIADGANVQQWLDNGTGAQRFAIEPADPSDPTVYKLVNQTSGKCVDIQDWSLDDRGNIQQWACSGNINQSFRLFAPGSSTPAVRR